uniref:Lectin 1 n=1 Tax=Arisaema heterophyllum TaxID=227498 RepID=A0A858C1W4_9ARAE|nr:lectin 1 [Arisaema heterophyllum]
MESEKKAAAVSRRNMAVGPWGGGGGSPWVDRSYSGVREIKLVYTSCIDSIQVLYDMNWKPFQAEKHGGNGGHQTAIVKLRYPKEFLTAVSGHYGPVVHGGGPVIRSLTLKTNQRSFGPFGVEEGTPFSFSIEGGSIVGFKGRAGWFLDAIGFRLRYPRSSSSLLGRVKQRLATMATKQLSSKNGDQQKSPTKGYKTAV